MVVSERFAHRLPAGFADSHAAPLLCAGVIGYRAVRLSQITNGQTIGLFGFGGSAHIVIQMVKHLFPDSAMFVFTRSDEHRQLAKDLGASWVGLPQDAPPKKVQRAIDFTPVGETVPRALGVLDKGGRLVINAIRKSTMIPPLDYGTHLWHEKEITSVANVTRKDVEEFLSLAARIPIVPDVREFQFSQVNEALTLLKQARVRAAAVLVVQ
jgi:propanol-preferring alcohol dehydrogenase